MFEFIEQEFDLWDAKEKKVIKVTAEKVGNGYKAICPKHDDHNPSLSIDEEKCLYNCFACGFSGRLYKKRKIVATYDHVDEEGKFLYQIVRYDPKGFAYRIKDENGNWKYGTEGIKKILYKLPELINADTDKPVLFVEGGKDVDNAIKNGFIATTYFLVKGEWPQEYNKYFADRNVILIPDNDDTGKQYSFNIGKGINGIAKQVKWLELPGLVAKEDISDWFEKGGSAEELNKLIEDAPDFSKILEEASNPQEPVEILGQPVFEKNKFEIKKTKGDLIDLYLDYVNGTIDSPDIYHVTSAILLISTLLERRVHFLFGTQKIYANIWAVIVAPSTTFRKSSSVNIAKNIIRTWYEKYLFPEEFSQEALMDFFQKNEAKGIFFWSEFGAFLGASKKQYMIGIKEFLSDLYDCPDFKKRILRTGSFEIKEPYINIYTATTMEWFLRSIEESDIMGGFLARFIYIVATMEDKKPLIAFPVPADTEKLNRFLHLFDIVKMIEGEATFDKESHDIYEKWLIPHEKAIDRLNFKQTISGFFGRLGTTCLKLSLIFQVSEDRSIIIKANAMKRSINFVEQLKENVYRLVTDKIGFSKEEREKKRILELIRERGTIDRSMLLMYSGMKSKTLDEYLNTLIEEGRIEKIEKVILYRNRKKTEYKFIN